MAIKKTTKKVAPKKKKVVAKKAVAKKAPLYIRKAGVKQTPKITLEELFAEIDAVFASDENVGHVHTFDAKPDNELEKLFDELFAEPKETTQSITLDELFADLDKVAQVTPSQPETPKAIDLDALFAELDTIDPQPVTPAFTSIITPTQPKKDDVEKEGADEMFHIEEVEEVSLFEGIRKLALSVGVAVVALAIGFTWLKVTQASYSQKKAQEESLIPIELQAQWQQIRNESKTRQQEIKTLLDTAQNELSNQ